MPENLVLYTRTNKNGDEKTVYVKDEAPWALCTIENGECLKRWGGRSLNNIQTLNWSQVQQLAQLFGNNHK